MTLGWCRLIFAPETQRKLGPRNMIAAAHFRTVGFGSGMIEHGYPNKSDDPIRGVRSIGNLAE
jgi:hypothetical protein